jgi:ABC-type oligopeptide transport system ATPase subunit
VKYSSDIKPTACRLTCSKNDRAISHDLLTVAAVCHRIAILHGGEIVETGRVAQVMSSPQHPYTRRSIGAIAKEFGILLPP